LDIIFNNPFRVLGLNAFASGRDLTKRTSDLETFAEFGKTKTYPNDFEFLAPFDRNLDSIKEASRKIESNEGKFFHSFFWFISHDSVDELALECLEARNVDKACELWTDQINKKSQAKFSWLLNRTVLQFINSNQNSFDKVIFDRALEDLGCLLDDYWDEVKEIVLGGSSKLDHFQVLKNIVDHILLYIETLDSKPYGLGGAQLLYEFSSFPSAAQDYVELKIFNPLIDEIQSSIEKSRAYRLDQDHLDLELELIVTNHLDEFDSLIYELDEFSENYKIKAIINDYVEEIRLLSIFVHNELKDNKGALWLINRAIELPSYSPVRADVEEAKFKLDQLFEEAEKEQLYTTVFSELNQKLTSLPEAQIRLNLFKKELSKIPNKDEYYLSVSSICVNHILNFMIDAFNNAVDNQNLNRNINNLHSVAKQVCNITAQLSSFSMDAETKTRFNNNFNTIKSELSSIESIKNQVSRNENSSITSESGKFELPWWVWIVGFCLLLAMCKG